ncbi:uncharacterized protein VSU04_011633 [Chlamydotis macqueenii]
MYGPEARAVPAAAPCAGLFAEERGGRGRPEPWPGAEVERGGGCGPGVAWGLQLPACSAAAEGCESRGARGPGCIRVPATAVGDSSPLRGSSCPTAPWLVLQRSGSVTSAVDKSRPCGSGTPGGEGQRPRPPRGGVSPKAATTGAQMAVIKDADVSEETQRGAAECAIQSLEECNVKCDTAAHVVRISVCA